MVTAEARKLQAVNPQKVAVMDRRSIRTARWHEIWENNPRIATPAEVERLKGNVQWLENYGGRRPYIDYNRTHYERYAWTTYHVEPPEIYLSGEEKTFASRQADCIVIEPSVKSSKQINKDWGWNNWVRLTDLMPHLPWTQVGPVGIRVLPRARHVVTRTTRLAAAAVSGARAIVTAEGGLHHCAAAFGIPGVVIFGGFISPATTGYACHTNLFTGGEACGWRTPCQHCRDALDRITPEAVATKLLDILKK